MQNRTLPHHNFCSIRVTELYYGDKALICIVCDVPGLSLISTKNALLTPGSLFLALVTKMALSGLALRAFDKATRGPGRGASRFRACRCRTRAGPARCGDVRNCDGAAEVVVRIGRVTRGDKAGWEVGGGEDRAFAEEDGALERVVELADVSRPGRGDQAPHRRVVDAVDPLSQTHRLLGHQGRDQGGDVVAAIAEWGKVNCDDVEPVKKVGPEPIGGDLGGQVLVGGRQDAAPGTTSGWWRPPATPLCFRWLAAAWPASNEPARRSRRGTRCPAPRPRTGPPDRGRRRCRRLARGRKAGFRAGRAGSPHSSPPGTHPRAPGPAHAEREPRAPCRFRSRPSRALSFGWAPTLRINVFTALIDGLSPTRAAESPRV